MKNENSKPMRLFVWALGVVIWLLTLYWLENSGHNSLIEAIECGGPFTATWSILSCVIFPHLLVFYLLDEWTKR